ncbi:MAG: flagellar hook-length control protein FliK [Selenomonadales bacterium]|nr:flagellar hook-length control protein FliK [Selenomonadales bacterium]
METANLMTAAIKPAAAKANVKGSAGKGSVKGKNTASFDDVLGKTSAKNEALSKLSENETDSDADSSTNDDAKGDSAGKDLLSLLLAAAMNNETNQLNDAIEAVPSDESAAAVVELSDQAVLELSAPLAETVKDESAAAVVDLSDQAALELSAPLAETVKNDNLQTLLPQNEQSLQENKNFLAMLSGQQIKKAALNSAAESNNQPVIKVTADSIAMTTPLEAELLKAQNQLSAASQEAVNRQAQAAAVTENLNEALLNTADSENVLADAQLAAETAVTVDNANVKENSNKISQLITGGASLTVEDAQQKAAPSANLADSEEQLDFSQEKNSNQQSGLSQQGNNPKLAVETNETSEIISKLAKEETASDKAVQPNEQQATATGKSELTPFGQLLRENIVNAKTSVTETAAPAPKDDFNITQQIIDQAKLIKRAENTEMVIKLNPEHLGELTLKVAVTSNGSVSASFHSDNVQVRTIIENSLVQLRSDLNQQGLKVDQVEVYAGLADGQLPQGEGQGAWQHQQGQQHNSNGKVLLNGQEYAAEAEEIVDAAGVEDSRADKKDSVDYRI